MQRDKCYFVERTMDNAETIPGVAEYCARGYDGLKQANVFAVGVHERDRCARCGRRLEPSTQGVREIDAQGVRRVLCAACGDVRIAGHSEQIMVHGSFNTAPPHMTEITEAQFAGGSAWGYPLRTAAVEFRQVPLEDSAGALRVHDLHLFYRDAMSGIVMAVDRPTKRVRWFRFTACEHDMRGLSPADCRRRGIYHGGNCYHVSECAKCGIVYAVDSSD